MAYRCLVLLAPLVCACSSSSNPSGTPSGNSDFGQHDLGSLDEACEGVSGLTGQAILDQQTDGFSATLSYVTATGGKVNPTPLTVAIEWPASPVATCYPTYSSKGQPPAEPRVAIEGLTLKFKTDDGQFDETLAAKAWYPVINGAPQFPQLMAVTTRGKLHGSWQPFPEYAVTSSTTMGFACRLTGATSAQSGGNVQATGESVAELDAGIARGGFALATYP
jgi:hypothetical protein